MLIQSSLTLPSSNHWDQLLCLMQKFAVYKLIFIFIVPQVGGSYMTLSFSNHQDQSFYESLTVNFKFIFTEILLRGATSGWGHYLFQSLGPVNMHL